MPSLTNDAKLDELGKRGEGNKSIETLQEKSLYILAADRGEYDKQ
jgi:hypothetical protein